MSNLENNLYLKLFNLSDDAILLLEGNKFIKCNPASIRMLRAKNEEAILNCHPADISPELQADGQNSWKKAQQMIEFAHNNGSIRFDWTHKRLDGEAFPAEVSLTLVKHDGKDLIYAVVRDISIWVSSQKALKDAEQKLRLIATHTDDLIWMRDLKFRYTYLSPSIERLKGWTIEEAMKLSALEIVPRSELKKAIIFLREELARDDDPRVNKDRGRKFQMQEYRKDGSIIWTVQSMSFIRDNEGKPVGFFGITHDISDYKKTLDALEKSKKKAEESDNLKSIFLANISHEIRTPLNSIVGFSELLTDESTKINERKQFAQIIKNSTSQLLTIISDIIDISKLKSNQITITAKAVNLHVVMKKIFQNYSNRFPENITDTCNFLLDPLPDNLATLFMLDEEHLVQIINNLLCNAFKFTKKGQVSFGASIQNESELRFYVKDTGRGIPFDKQAVIFEHFRQGEENLDRQFGGTGLGLAICQGLVKLMGGEIGVISTPGEGSEFWFTLPLVNQAS